MTGVEPTRSHRWYRMALKLLPSSYRRRQEEEMYRLYSDLARAASGKGRQEVFRLRLRASIDLLLTACRTWASPSLRGPRTSSTTRLLTGRAMGYELRQAARTLRRSPLFSTLAVSTLALGIGANTAIFSVAFGVLMRPLGLESSENLAVVTLHRVSQPGDVSGLHPSYLKDLRELVAGSTHVDRIGGYIFESGTLMQDDSATEISSAIVADLEFFQVLRPNPVVGRLPDSADVVPGQNAKVCLISASLWSSRFGSDPKIIGRSAQIDGRDLTIIGVLPDGTPLPQSGVDLWTLQDWDESDRSLLRRLNIVTRLQEDTSRDGASLSFASAARTLGVSYPRFSDYTLTLVGFRESIVGGVRPAILTATACVGLILLIACANMANLLLARASGREREIATRRAIGADSWQVVRQILSESLLLSLLGGLLGAFLAVGIQKVLIALAPPSIPRLDAVRLDVAEAAFTVAVSLISGMLFGVAPIAHALRLDPMRSLRAGATGPGPMRLRHALLILQIAVAVTLLVSASLMMQSLLQLRAVDPGFRLAGIGGARIYLDDSAYPNDPAETIYWEEILRRLGQVVAIESAGATSGLPLDPVAIDFDLPYLLPGVAAGEETAQSFFRSVTEGYFETMGMKVLQGRTFDGTEDSDSETVAVINAKFAEHGWPDQSPIGQTFQIYGGSRELRIVGVVDDVRFGGPSLGYKPEFFVPFRQMTFGAMTVVARSASAETAASAIRDAAIDLDPRQPVNSTFTLEGLARGAISMERFLTTLLGAFSVIALLLAGAGIYGVFSFWVSRSRWELGLRRALGATRHSILLLVLSRSLRFAGVGLAIGVGASLLGSRLLAGVLFGVEPTDLTVLLLVSAALALTAVFAALVPARRAAQVAPVTSLGDD